MESAKPPPEDLDAPRQSSAEEEAADPAAAGWLPAEVSSAPEPSDVVWENLGMGDEYQAKMQLRSFVATSIVLALACVIMIFVTVGKGELTSNPGWTSTLSSAQTVVFIRAITYSSSLVTLAINMLIKWVVTEGTEAEGLDTKSDVQSSLFFKLSMSYTINSCLIPIGVGVVQSLFVTGTMYVTQAWYETGGVVDQVLSVIVMNMIVPEAKKVVPHGHIMARLWKAKKAASRQKAIQLWTPPAMNLGEMYAATFKTIALGLVFAPLFPLAYAFTSVACFVCYWATKVAVSFWLERPPAMNAHLLGSLRACLGAVLLMQVPRSSAPPSSTPLPLVPPQRCHAA